MARAQGACYTARVPYIEPEEYRPEPPLRPQITGPIAWEDASLSWSRRLGRTLAATFAPLETLHAVANGEIAPAIRFALLTAAPFMMIWGIVPFTHTLWFKPEFGLEVLSAKATQLSIELDVVRAMGIGFALMAISLLSWGLPFVSLVRAFADGSRPEDPGRAAVRTTLYRMWVIPLGMAAFSLVLWALPSEPNPFLMEVTLLGFQMLPRVLMLAHCHAMARYFGASGLGALAVALVPLAVEWAIGLTVQQGVQLLLPATPPTES